jgi:hypothetical protein
MVKGKKAPNNNDNSQKTGRKGWTTEEQFAYLSSLIPSYLEAQAKKKVPDLWPGIFEGWFQRWPLVPPSDKDIAAGLGGDARYKATKLVSENLCLRI